MKTLVIDASVAIKWVIEEPGSDQALALRSFRLCAPDLLIVECANILWKKVRRKELIEKEALLAGRLLERAEIDLVPMRHMLGRAVTLSVELDHPAYDCLYLALAEASGIPFITADENLCRRIRSHGLSAHVMSLPDTASFLFISDQY